MKPATTRPRLISVGNRCVKRRTIIVAGWVAAAAVCPLHADAENLMDIYADARMHDPTLATTQAVRGVQKEVAAQARAKLLPQWSAQYVEERIQPDRTREQQVTHTISQVVFDLSQLRTLDAERTLIGAEDARVQAAEADLCARVTSAYFGVLTAQAVLETSRSIEDAYRQQVAQAQARFDAKLVAQQDVEQARAYYELARVTTAQASESLEDARQAVAEITGHAPGELATLAQDLPMIPPHPADADAWVDQALRENPTLQAGALDLAASEQRVGAIRGSHLPTLSAGIGGQRLSGSAVSSSSAGYANTVSLTLTIPIFAGGAVESQKREAVYKREQQSQSLESSRRTVIRNTRAYYQAVMSALAQMQVTRSAMEASDRALVSTRTGMELGARSMTDLLLAIQTQSNARSAWDKARHQYVLNQVLLRQAAGHLSVVDLEQVNALLVRSP
jgi:outer membrane protein